MTETEKISLCVESSALPYGVVLSVGNHILFDSTEHPELSQLKDVPALTKHALRTLDRKASELERIIVNHGPGGTSAIRSGVSFVNSLAYSLKIPVVAINAFELLGEPLTRQYGCPTLVTVKSVRGNAYVGWYANGAVQHTLYGPMEATVRQAVGDAPEWVIAGAHREQVQALFAERTVHDSGRKFGRAADMPAMLAQRKEDGLVFPQYVIPITEQSSIFNA